MTDHTELRKLAEAATRYEFEPKDYVPPVVCRMDFKDACTPATILSLLDRLEKAEKDAAVAIGMLADWCVAVDQNGAGWDDWDEHYKDAMYRPCPIREQLDEAIKSAMEASK